MRRGGVFGEDGNTYTIDFDAERKVTLLARYASIWGAALASVVVSGGSLALNYAWSEYQTDRKEIRRDLDEIKQYMFGAQERGRALTAIVQRHENDIQELRQTITIQGNRITAIETEQRTRDRK